MRRRKTPWGEPCVVIPGHIIRKPDPCIYDQFLLMQLNQPVTWDNPDVKIFKNGIEQYTYDLVAGTDYDVEVTVHNSSRDKPANGTRVDIGWIEFGAGGQVRHPIAAPLADVPIWPGTATVGVQWRTPDTPGHYCIEVELSHPNDGDPSNNRGWNNTQVHAANSPVTRPIRIFNRHPGECPPVLEGGRPILRAGRVLYYWGGLGMVAAMTMIHRIAHSDTPVRDFFLLIALGYAFGAGLGLVAEAIYGWLMRQRDERRGRDPRRDRTDCHLVEINVDSYLFEDRLGKDFDPETAFRGAPPAWPANVEPPSFVFQPGEAYRDVELRVDAPDNSGPAANFNVNVRQGGVPSGGVTVTITRGS